MCIRDSGPDEDLHNRVKSALRLDLANVGIERIPRHRDEVVGIDLAREREMLGKSQDRDARLASCLHDLGDRAVSMPGKPRVRMCVDVFHDHFTISRSMPTA